MLRQRLSRHAPLLTAVGLAFLLLALAWLQHHWILQVSSLYRHRMRVSLVESGSRFTEDFDREISRAWFSFHADPRDTGDPRDVAVRRYRAWLANAPDPRLIREVYSVDRDEAGGFRAEVLRPAEGRFVPVPWPADLTPLRRRLEGLDIGGPGFGVDARVPALIVPRFPLRAPGERRMGREPLLILRLDEGEIRGHILPALTRRHFGDGPDREYAVAVVSAADGRVIFQSDPGEAARVREGGDASLPLFGLRPFEELRGIWSARDRPPGPLGHFGHFGGNPGGADAGAQPHGLGPPGDGAWRLVLLHRGGSLDQAVSHFRIHNLLLSTTILALLTAAIALMMVTTQRARRLARQQVELVAGVTHELHTPITALRSAGQNLADGVVADPAQVKRYGDLIVREGRRLSQMVGLMLELAGLQSGQETYTLRPTEVQAALDGALEDCRWLLDERRARVEADLAADLPPVLGDAGALRRALRNLIENAAKYGGRAPWIGVRARAAGNEVAVTVEDHGPGIDRADLPHLFEPFYRGREVKTGGIPGSGLGLSVVRRIAEAHRGRVTVAPRDGGPGSAFTLHLPAAPPGAAA
jgi:signal transduction histidine kinase